jgi:predicted dehydrogenase
MLRFAVIGTGFWANYQVPAWKELDGVELVALYNRTKPKAEALAHQYNVPSVYDDIDLLLKREKLDFVDIITDVDTHAQFTELAARKKVAVICQKPMAPKLPAAKKMVALCEKLKVPFYIHENFRGQAPVRKMKALLNENVIGRPFKARVSFCSGFPVFDNQPFLAELDEFILTDVGSHILDVCRFLFGEVNSLQCHTETVTKGIKGEDVANIFMKMENGISCFAEMSYASIQEYEPFPQTFVYVEGESGSIHLTRDYELRITTREGTRSVRAEPKLYPWLDPAYALVHSSIVDCNRNLCSALQRKSKGETSGRDNLETVRLVHAAYASAKRNTTIKLKDFSR